MSEYMLHSNFGKAVTGVIGGNFGAYTFILLFPWFTKYLTIFLDVLSAERLLKQIKNTSEFPQINSCCFRRQAHSSSSVRVQTAK